MTLESKQRTGAVAIGRNEGDRLLRCLRSLVDRFSHVVYVDSGSSDSSVSIAEALGVTVLNLNMDTPFTAARARNAGVQRLLELSPDIEFIHFIDGDCELAEGWLEAAVEAFDDDKTAAVWGRLKEYEPEKSVYNYLCDLEWKWNWAYGEVRLCGGIALMRVSAIQEAGLFNEQLIAGEEPELCLRLRKRGWKIFRVDKEMATHDAGMTRFSQWWQRGVRGGYADAERAHMYRRDPDEHWSKTVRGVWFWGLGVPVVALGGALPTHGWSLVILGGYLLSVLRIFRGLRKRGAAVKDSAIYAAFCTLAKFSAVTGQLKFVVGRVLGRRSTLIEYK